MSFCVHARVFCCFLRLENALKPISLAVHQVSARRCDAAQDRIPRSQWWGVLFCCLSSSSRARHTPAERAELTAGNQISSLIIPDGKLLTLKHLKIAANKLTSFPLHVCRLVNILSLDLSFNGLFLLAEQIGARGAQGRARFANAHAPPSSHVAGQLHMLRSLQLRANALAELPSELSHCRALRVLDVARVRRAAFVALRSSLRRLRTRSPRCPTSCRTSPSCASSISRTTSSSRCPAAAVACRNSVRFFVKLFLCEM